MEQKILGYKPLLILLKEQLDELVEEKRQLKEEDDLLNKINYALKKYDEPVLDITILVDLIKDIDELFAVILKLRKEQKQVLEQEQSVLDEIREKDMIFNDVIKGLDNEIVGLKKMVEKSRFMMNMNVFKDEAGIIEMEKTVSFIELYLERQIETLAILRKAFDEK